MDRKPQKFDDNEIKQSYHTVFIITIINTTTPDHDSRPAGS